MPDNDFGRRLREARHDAGLSQNGLADRSGVPKTRLSRYENGYILPSLRTLARLALALGVAESFLLGERPDGFVMLAEALDGAGVRIRSQADADEIARVAKGVLSGKRRRV